MTSALLLVPVSGVLVWLYGYFLPQRWAWSPFDVALLCAASALVAVWIGWANAADFEDAGPIFAQLVAAAGGYTIIVVAFAAGLGWRRAEGKRGITG